MRRVVGLVFVMFFLLLAPHAALADQSDADARAAAIVKNGTLRDFLMLGELGRLARTSADPSKLSRDLDKFEKTLDAYNPDKAFWLQPATVDNLKTLTVAAAPATAGAVALGWLSGGTIPVVAVASSLLNEAARRMGETVNEDERTKRTLLAGASQPGYMHMLSIVNVLESRMSGNGGAQQVFDARFGDKLKTRATSTRREVGARNPDLASLWLSEDVVVPDLNKLSAQVTTLLTDIRAAKAAELADKQWDDRIRTIGAGVGLVTTILARSDPVLARKVDAVSSAALKIASTLRMAQTLSKFALTFNVAGAALSALSAFGGGGGGSDAAMMKQLAAIQQSVENLRQEMHERFDRIDARLTTLLDLCTNAFQKFERSFVVVRAELDELSRAVNDVSFQICHTDAKLSAMLSAGFARSDAADNDRCLGVQVRTGVAHDFATFVDCESRLFSNIDHAYDPASLAPAYDPATPDALLPGLLTASVGENARFLSSLGATRWGLASSGNNANPAVWALAADAYATLLEENPWHAQRIARSRRESILDRGRQLQLELSRLLLDGSGAPNHAFYDHVIDWIDGQATNVASEVTKREEWVRSGFADAAQRAYPLWGNGDPAPPASLQLAPVPVSFPPEWADLMSAVEVPAPGAVDLAAYLPDRVRWWLVLSKTTATASLVVTPEFAQTMSAMTVTDVSVDHDWAMYQCSANVEVRGASLLLSRHERRATLAVYAQGGLAAFSFVWGAAGPDTLTPEERAQRDAAVESELSRALQPSVLAINTDVSGQLAVPGRLHDAATTLSAAPTLVRALLSLGDDMALQLDDELLSLLASQVPALTPASVAARFANAPADIARPERAKWQADVLAWSAKLRAAIHAYLDQRASGAFSAPLTPLQSQIVRIEALGNGPLVLSSESAVSFPFVTIEGTDLPAASTVDLAWSIASPPPDREVTGAWSLSTTPRLTGALRVCAEPQRTSDVLMVEMDGRWQLLVAEPGLPWLCAAAARTPTRLALVTGKPSDAPIAAADPTMSSTPTGAATAPHADEISVDSEPGEVEPIDGDDESAVAEDESEEESAIDAITTPSSTGEQRGSGCSVAEGAQPQHGSLLLTMIAAGGWLARRKRACA